MTSKKEKMVPEIRFKGYVDNWEQRKLKTIYKKIRNAFVGTATPYYVSKNEDGYFYLESNNVKNGSINRNTEVFINQEFYQKQKDKWLKTGDIVMVQSGHVGHTAVIPENLNNTAAHALIMFQDPKIKVNPYFINAEFQTESKKKMLDIITTGNTIKHILSSEMQEFKMNIPHSSEQDKIADFFKSLDDTITLHQQKLALLQQVKQTLLTLLFPEKEARIPHVRFANFTERWEQRTIFQVADKFDNLRIPITASDRVTGNTPYYGANGIQDYVDGFTHEGEFVLVAEDGANDLQNYPVQYVNGKVWVNNHAHVLQGKIGLTDTKFLMSAIKIIHIEPFLVGGGRAKLNADVMMKLKLSMPSLEEQVKLGVLSEQVDHLITLHQKKLNNLQQIKTSLLNKLFV